MKGYQKKVIFLKNTGSHFFDEAYFVISRQGEEAAIGQSDMILEANRIIRESIGEDAQKVRREKGERTWSFFPPFFLGVFVSSALMLIFYLIYLFS